MTDVARRLHVRVYYPAERRPSLLLDTGSLEVVDLSERGLRFTQYSGPEPRVGARIEGILRLGRESLPVRGRVVRVAAVDPGNGGAVEVGAYLSDLAIPRRVIIAERQGLERARSGS